MREKDATKKLKLICSFNGKFRCRTPGEKPRYTGGESRIISVDPTTLTFAKLCSLISQLFRVANSNFRLKYQLPGFDSGDSPLVLLATDDDVLCMVEEYEKVALYGKNFSRLWVYVFNGNDDYPFENFIETGDFDYGFGFLGENLGLKGVKLNACLESSNGFENLLDDNTCVKKIDHKNNVGRKKVSSDYNCLRKLVLKQQLLAKKSSLGANVENHDQPLIDLEPDTCDLSAPKKYVNNAKSDSCGRKFHCNENFPSDAIDFGGVISTLPSKSYPLNLGDCNLLDEKNRNKESTVKVSNGLNPHPHHVSCDDQVNGKDSVTKCFHRGHRCIRSHKFRMSDVRNQGVSLYCHNRGHCMGKLSGNILVGAKCYPGLGVLKQRQSMKIHCSNSSSRRVSRPHRSSKAVRKRSLNNANKANMRKQANEISVKPQVLQCVGVHSTQITENPLIDLREEPIGVKYKDNYDKHGATIVKCKPYDAKVNAPQMVSKNKDHAPGGLLDTANAELVHHNALIGSHPMPNRIVSSVDRSSFTSSKSSSEVATDALSHVRSAVFGLSQMTQLKDLGPRVEAKQLAEMEVSNRKTLHSVIDIISQWDKSLSLKEELQDDPSVSPKVNDKMDSTNRNYSNGGVPCDLSSIYTHPPAQGFQTIKHSDLEYIKELGSGNFGTVYHGKWKGSDVAIKKIKPNCFIGDKKDEERMIADFWKEAHLLGQLHHPNIVAFYGVVTDGPVTNLATVTEYMLNGSLKQVLQRKSRTIDHRKRLILAMDAAFGMEYLHEKRIVHFDLKSQNFLVNMRDSQRPVCKIGDLGLSKIKQRTMVSGGVRGTIPWMAPELLNAGTNLVTEKVDVYSFGIVMWELLTEKEPYAGLCAGDIIVGITKGTLRPEIPNWCEPAWRSLMEMCWSSDPKSRPSFPEIAKELRAMSAAMNIK